MKYLSNQKKSSNAIIYLQNTSNKSFTSSEHKSSEKPMRQFTIHKETSFNRGLSISWWIWYRANMCSWCIIETKMWDNKFSDKTPSTILNPMQKAERIPQKIRNYSFATRSVTLKNSVGSDMVRYFKM